MRIVVTEIEASVKTSIGGNLKFLWQEPISCVCHDIQCVNLLLVHLRIYELIVVSPLIVSHVRLQALLEVSVKEGLQAVVVV